MASLKKIGEVITDEIHRTQYIELIERLAKGDLYSMRISSCYLISEAYKRSRAPEQEKLSQIYYELCGNDTPMVRRAAATNLGDFATAAGEASNEMIEAFQKLLKDPQDAVKTEAVKNSVIVSKMVMDHHNYKLEETVLAAIED